MKFLSCERDLTQKERPAWIAGLRNTTEVKHNLKQLMAALLKCQLNLHRLWQQREEAIQIVSDPLRAHVLRSSLPSSRSDQPM